MKRCPECRRDYYDDTLLYCLEDGVALVQGSVPSPDEPATVLLSEPGAIATGFRGDEGQTAAFVNTTDQTAILRTGAAAESRESLGEPSDKRSFSANRAARPLIAAALAVVVLLGGFFGYRYLNPAASGQINSVAVLPFENRSGNEDTDYLSDGLADSLIYRLSQLPNLKVSPTSSVMRYKGSSTDVSQIAKELEVDAVMSGRLTQRGDDLSISVQLIDSRTNKVIWAEQYDRKMADLLATQREIATTITQKLQLKLAGEEKGITKKYTDSNEAYQLYLKGRYHFARRTKEDVNKAIENYEQAIKIDPNFAIAYARIAEAYNQMPNYPYASPREAFPKAKAAAERAIAIDPMLSEAHTAMGNTLTSFDWNWTAAEDSFRRALDLDPNSATTHYRYASEFLVSVGRTKEAVSEVERALEIEPLDSNMVANLARVYLYDGQRERAIEQARRAYEADPNFVIARLIYGLTLNATGGYAEAIALSEKELQINPNNQHMLLVAGYAYASTGRRADAQAIIERLNELSKTQYVIPSFVAAVYGSMGEKDKAFTELQKSIEVRDSWFKWGKVEPLFDTLRDDPRFKDLLKRMNLPE